MEANISSRSSEICLRWKVEKLNVPGISGCEYKPIKGVPLEGAMEMY